MEPRGVRIVITGLTCVTMLFLYFPLAIVIVYAFNGSPITVWPPSNFTLHWFDAAIHNPEVRDAFVTSVKAGVGAMTIALVLGTTVAFSVHRFTFFGRNTISFALVLPIALPGVLTGIALASAISYGNSLFGLQFSLFTVIVGHATFCVVVVYNNVIARLRRTGSSLVEASMDLGGDGWQTFRHVTFPSIGTAVLAGALLAFALSFDEIVVTTFTAGGERTLPIWILTQIGRGTSLPEVNAVAVFVILISVIPVYIAQRLTAGEGAGAVAGGRPGGDSGVVVLEETTAE